MRGINDKKTYTWLQTYSNLELDYADDEWICLPIEDIAHALSNLCRFNGHCKKYYSVAEHSVIVSYLVPEHLAIYGLLHDASEAYTGDIPTGFKRVMGLSFSVYEDKALKAISKGYGLDYQMFFDLSVQEYDIKVLGHEAASLMPNHIVWKQFPDRFDIPVHGHLPHEAKQVFLARYHELRNKALYKEAQG
jgi:hypothetical protein